MPTQTYTLADVTLKSTWKCYQNAVGTYISTEPTTATNGDRVVPVSGLPDGAIINSAVLTYTVPYNPLNGAEISTLNGNTIGWRVGTHSANLGITGNGNFQLMFAFKDYGAQHSHTQSHSSAWILTNLVVTIDYTNPYYASDWSIGAASVDAGNPIQVTLSPAGSGYNHKITAVFGSYSTSVDLATGVNVGSVPTALDWLRAIPNAAAGTANLTLTTYHSGNVIGTSAKSVTITAPSSIVPTLDAAVERLLTVGSATFPDVTGGYVQQKSAAKCRITSASGAYGSTITGYSINVGGRTDAAFNSSGTELSTAALPMAGDVTITFRVTDSRGRTAQVVKTITVEPYSEPKANNLTVMRVDDSGNEDANGTKGRYSFTRIFSSLGGKNTCVAAITAAGTTVENVEDSGWIVPGTIKTLDVLSSYRVEIKLTDVYGSSTTVATIPSINFALHFSADGTSLWVGEACQKSNAFGVSPKRDVYFYGQELKTLIKNNPPGELRVDDRTALLAFANASDGYGFQAGTPGSGHEFNIGRMNSSGPVVMWVNGSNQGGAIYTEGNPPPALAAYPVGSIYMSTDATSPASLFGGSWEQLPGDRYLLSAFDAATNSWTGGEMGGAWYYSLVANIGTINGDYAVWGYNHTNPSAYQANHAPLANLGNRAKQTEAFSGWNHSTVVSEINTNSDSVLIVPPYYRVFMWRRIS